MLTLFKISLLFSLFFPFVYSVCEQFPYGDGPGDTFETSPGTDEILNQAFNPSLPLGCTNNPAVGRYNIYVSGRVTFTPSISDNTPSLSFNVFNVDINDISIRNMSYRYIAFDNVNNPNDPIKKCAVDSFNQFYQRQNLTEGSFNPTHILLVTWNLTQSMISSGMEISDSNSPRNIFQFAYMHHGKRALIFFLYNNVNWGTNTATVVGLEACGSSPSGAWTDAQTAVEKSNLATTRSGEWLFYLNGTGHLFPAVVCKVGCSLTNGFCTKEDTCICREGWSGDLCTTPVCSQGCVNGTCDNPDNCVCYEGWLGASCNQARCYSACINGECRVPDVCTCREGFNGSNCTNAMCSQVCGPNGFCTGPNHCSCIQGYTGGSSPCTPVCNDECLNGGNCTAPNTCTCPSGYAGPRCNTTIVSSTVMESPSPTIEPTDPPDGTTASTPGNSLSSTTVGAITGGIIALVLIVVIITIIIVVALISC